MSRLGRIALPLALFISVAASSAGALACGTGNVLFKDDFSKLDRAWGITLGKNASVGADGFKLTYAANNFYSALNQSSLYDDYEICMKAAIEYKGDDGPYFGVVFWGVDDKNYYSLDLAPNTQIYSVWRLQKNRALKPIPWTESKAVVKDSGQVNEISVLVKGKHAVVSINGQKVDELDGVQPDGGSVIGFEYGTSKSDKGESTMILKSIEVREAP
ncbi:MAG: hypothetical protein U1E53_08730 [Dongiaceae bacterium]